MAGPETGQRRRTAPSVIKLKTPTRLGVNSIGGPDVAHSVSNLLRVRSYRSALVSLLRLARSSGCVGGRPPLVLVESGESLELTG